MNEAWAGIPTLKIFPRLFKVIFLQLWLGTLLPFPLPILKLGNTLFIPIPNSIIWEQYFSWQLPMQSFKNIYWAFYREIKLSTCTLFSTFGYAQPLWATLKHSQNRLDLNAIKCFKKIQKKAFFGHFRKSQRVKLSTSNPKFTTWQYWIQIYILSLLENIVLRVFYYIIKNPVESVWYY